MSDSLREMVLTDTARNLEKIHDSIAKLNDDLRYLRGRDLNDLNDDQLAMVKQLLDGAAGIALLQVLLEHMVIRKLKEDSDE